MDTQKRHDGTDPTKRFGDRVHHYMHFRPRYPEAVLEILREETGLEKDWHIADIGSGTGFLTELLLTDGNPVWGVEPNPGMRTASESLLKDFPNFMSVDGRAESTTLPDASIDLIAAGQAFHWFDPELTRAEFMRILRDPHRVVALVWNDRDPTHDPFGAAYEAVLLQHAPDYGESMHRRLTDENFRDFFGGPFTTRTCANHQELDLDGVLGRALSSSYTPREDEPGHEAMMQGLRDAFAAHQEDGTVRFEYVTQICCGRLA